MLKKTMIDEVKSWINEAAETIRKNMTQEIEVLQKNGRTDLVTNIDKETQAFLISKINKYYPKDRILAEEQGYSTIDSLDGRVWIIDPIDGTLNFVLEKENFCIMLAVYEEGIGKVGFIYDVMQKTLYWGGKEYGVYCDSKRLKPTSDRSLSEGLLGVNSYMYGDNIHQATVIGRKSMGVRISGCAGLEFISMLKGNRIAYLSNLSPWDYAAGIILIEALGFKYGNIQGNSFAFSEREYFVAATGKAFKEIIQLISSEQI